MTQSPENVPRTASFILVRVRASSSCSCFPEGQLVEACDLSSQVNTCLLVLTTIRFPLVRCVCLALGFLPVHCALKALGFSPIGYKAEARRPLVTSSLLVTCWNWALRGTFCSLLMFVVLMLGLVSFAPIWWSKLTSSLWGCPGVYTLWQMHHSGFHSFHGDSDRIYILLDMCQSLCLCFFLNDWEFVILH